MAIDRDFWRGRRVLVTGHTGFKGAWLCMLLQRAGARVTGLSLLPSTTPNLYTLLSLEGSLDSRIGDIRNADVVEAAVAAADPDTVFHLAAQPLVRAGYEDPVGTYATNVLGTVHVLDALRRAPSLQAAVIVTTDKCYANDERIWGFRENEPMGGDDPYSSSKGAAELVAHAYRTSYFAAGGGIATARAGNVIGGGDWSKDRLVPDVVRAVEANVPVVLRNPGATRPWQHVLEPLAGYMLLAQKLANEPRRYAGGWNFGPDDDAQLTVESMAQALIDAFGGGATVEIDRSAQPHEAHLLRLDSTKAKTCLGWKPKLTAREAVALTAAWYAQWSNGADPIALTTAHIEEYCSKP